MRAGKRLRKIRERLNNENIKSKADAKKMVVDDWKRAQNVRVVD
jgi:hypothetical protein